MRARYEERTWELERAPRQAGSAHSPLPPHPVVLAGLGNAALSRVLQRETATAAPPRKPVEQRYHVQIGSEWVEIESFDEAAEAERIIGSIRERFGIEVSSLRAAKAVKKDYPEWDKDVLTQVRPEAWRLKELRALYRALARFAPILGRNRASSTRRGSKQELLAVGRVTSAVDETKDALDPGTLAQYFESSKAFAMFASLSDDETGFAGDNAKAIEATAIHEVSHGLMDYALPAYVSGLEYWADEAMPSGKDGAEAPITPVGMTSAEEDLAESMAMYFVDPGTLRDGTKPRKPLGTVGNPCPKRYALVDGFVKNWKPKR